MKETSSKVLLLNQLHGRPNRKKHPLHLPPGRSQLCYPSRRKEDFSRHPATTQPMRNSHNSANEKPSSPPNSHFSPTDFIQSSLSRVLFLSKVMFLSFVLWSYLWSCHSMHLPKFDPSTAPEHIHFTGEITGCFVFKALDTFHCLTNVSQASYFQMLLSLWPPAVSLIIPCHLLRYPLPTFLQSNSCLQTAK